VARANAAADLFHLGQTAVVELCNQKFFEAARAGGKNMHERLSLERLENNQ